MPTLEGAGRFLIAYTSRFRDLISSVSVLEGEVKSLLSAANIGYHVVTARAKSIESVRGKLLKKEYSRPAARMTDQIGVRIIVYRANEVDAIAKVIASNWSVIKAHSVDKREALGLREFGYRSYHLVCRIPDKTRARSRWKTGFPTVCEVQIRSILEHVWAEIEHSVVYKAGADLPKGIKRRFASVAGALELLEHEFARLSEETSNLVGAAVKTLSVSPIPKVSLDVPHLLALLEVVRPGGRSFRQAVAEKSPFPPGVEGLLQLALRRCGIKSTSALLSVLENGEFVRAQKIYSAAQVVPVSELSHLAICLLIVGVRNRLILTTFFPEFWNDSSLKSALS